MLTILGRIPGVDFLLGIHMPPALTFAIARLSSMVLIGVAALRGSRQASPGGTPQGLLTAH